MSSQKPPSSSSRSPESLASRASLASLAVIAIAALAVACGGGAPATNAPASYGSPEAPEPNTIEQAQEQIARASEELGTSRAAQPAVPPAPADQADVSSESTMREPKPSPRAETKSESACASQCRAIASMRRAVAALCRMTGADDARCKDATHTLTTSEQRVSACSC